MISRALMEDYENSRSSQALVAGWTVLSRKTIKGGTRAQVVLRRGGQEAVIAIAHNGVGCSIVISNTLPQA